MGSVDFSQFVILLNIFAIVIVPRRYAKFSIESQRISQINTMEDLAKGQTCLVNKAETWKLEALGNIVRTNQKKS